ncbi:acetate--CoA ligase [Candidatus Marinamargulisbacteria bacterium SCGC AG-343-D04]|nr:acetate--CoA ligase [Candidatus Marinamargulisbacteria bacterium SCGC AG-343-D04]
MSFDAHYISEKVFQPSLPFKENAVVNTDDLYQEADQDRMEFWNKQAQKLEWIKPWEATCEWNKPFAKWFVNGKLNASVNCIDRHLETKKDKIALQWEGENGLERNITYKELSQHVNQLSNVLRNQLSVKKGDRVTLYMPLIPELVFAVLACARIGAIHSVVFGGFSAESLKDRVQDSDSKLVITADGGSRRGKILNLKNIVDEALDNNEHHVENVLVVKHAHNDCHWEEGRDVDYQTSMEKESAECKAEVMDSEDPLFILYTSGTTGKPKGILHTTGGYLTHATYSTKVVFDLKDDDVYWCTADIGWITGHTYLTYGPLSNGATVFMYEGTPDYPDQGIFWKLIEKYKISIMYTAPTAIRSFMKWGDHIPAKYDLSSLRLLGSVGEPINPEAWTWYYTHIGNNNCPIVDTWWQTETGGIMISTLPGLHNMKPGYAGKPLPGISADICDHKDASVQKGGGLLSLTEPWPSMARGIWGDNERFKEVYWSQLDSYFTGDGAIRDKDGYIMVLGRVDDVINIAGHRIGTMEVESSLVDCDKVAEAAVVGVQDEIKGQALLAFVILKKDTVETDELKYELKQFVSKKISPIAKPKFIVFTEDLPKTRSGKIMRRLLKAIALNQEVGDTTSLANPGIVSELRERFKKEKKESIPQI